MATQLDNENGSALRRAPARRETIHRQLRIVAGVEGERAKAFAYQGGRKFLAAEGQDVDDAIEQLIRSIDAVHERRLALRRDGVPTPDEYADALARLGKHLTPIQETLLARHAALPGGRARLRQLAEQVGIPEEAAQRAYARLGRYLADILDFQPADPQVRKALQPVLVLAEPIGQCDDSPEWVLRASLTVAVQDSTDFRPRNR